MKRIVSVIFLLFASWAICMGQANVNGRTLVGSLPRPTYASKAEGIVVVQVKIDQYGNVTEAIPGAEGTTITDKALWNAARIAATKAHFNMDANAPVVQNGTIAYQFGSDGFLAGNDQKETTSVRDLVENYNSGSFRIKALFVEVLGHPSQLLFSVEENDYIIPIKLIKKDLGAEKRFRSLDLHKGDTLTIEGNLDMIDVSVEEFKGLKDATILDVRKVEYVVNGTNGEIIPFQLVDQKPSFNGGDANEFSNWVNAHLKYPKFAKDNGVHGRVTVQFTIRNDGCLTDVQVLRGVEDSLDKEAVRVVSMSPKWSPGKHKGEPVNVRYTFPVIFQLR